MTSPRLMAAICSIVEVDSPFDKESQPVAQIQTRRRSSIFEETIMPDPSVCRWLLDIISEDEHMTKESAYFILSGPQLIRVVAYKYEVPESQVEVVIEDETCCSKFCHDGTETFTDIAISNVNIITLDVDKANLLRDSYKICLQNVRKISSILDLGEISSRIMRAVSFGLMQVLSKLKMDGDLHILDIILRHDKTLFGSTRYNTIAPDVYTRPEVNELLNEKADKSDLEDYYSKSETFAKEEVYNKTEADQLLSEKADKTELIDSYNKSETYAKDEVYSKNETDELLDEKVNEAILDDYYTKTETYAKIETYNKSEVDGFFDEKADIGTSYTKGEDDAMLVLKADKTQLIDSYTKTEDDALLLLKADKADLIDSQTKTEDDALLLLKADMTNLIDSYIKTEEDAMFLLKTDKTDLIDSYSKSEDDALLLLKADKDDLIDSYTKAEDDALFLLKADKIDLDNFVDLSSAQTISGQKQFGIVNVSSISKLSKNDASILLAGGGDMLVSSLLTQPQLQEVREIAQGKSKGDVFATTDEMNTWMEDQENVAKVSIGDNLYIVDKQVMDQWWDSTNLRVLETELPDMSNVVTTLGTATGNGNAITDISINGNVITPAKNTTFVTNNYVETITGQKTFNTTIHSVGIMVQTYDNNSVVCAGGGVKAISDITANYYNKSETYSQTETNNLLNNKANTGVSYTKGDDDALLLLKADKTQLVDSQTKGETNNLLNNKADSGVSYTKGEDDALLLLKADKTYLIDSYTNIETNNLLSSKSDSGLSYTKGEDDTLLLAKADKTQLIDSYTKSETNNLLTNKANQSTTQTKTETDYLISQFDVGDVDLTDYYNKTKTDELLGEKADITKLSNYMTLGISQTINANKTFNNACRFVSSIDEMSTVTGSSFVKSGADDTVVLLGAGGTKPISEFAGRLKYVSPFGGTYDETQDPVENTYMTQSEVDAKLTNVVTANTTQSITGAKTFFSNVSATGFVKTGKDDTSVLLTRGGDRLISSFGGIEDLTSSAFNFQDDVAVATYISFPNHTVYKGVQIQMTVYIDEALLDAAGLMDFPELYAYIKEKDPKPPTETAPPVPIGEQTLQEQVKISADILENTNEVFVPSEPNMPVKIDYVQQIVNKPFDFNEMQPTLIVYGDRVTLNCFVTIKQQFKGYVFNSYPHEAQPKDNIKIIAVIGNNFSNNINLFCYIDENGPYVYAEDDREIAANTSIIISTTYYKQFEALKQINNDSNNDGKVDIMVILNGSGQGTHATQSHVYDVVKKQSDLVDHHIEGTVLHNFLNNDIKLQDKLGIYKADRTAQYIQDGPIVTFSFGARLGDNVGNVYKIFSTIDSKILPPYAKYHAMHPEQKEFKGYCQKIQQLDKLQGFQVIISGKLDKKDCEFSGIYVIDNYQNLNDANEQNENQQESIIDEVIIKCDRKLETHSIYQYTITNEIGQLEIVQGFNLGSPHNTFYIVDDGACNVRVFNLLPETKGFYEQYQPVSPIPDQLVPTNNNQLVFPATIMITVGDSYQTDTFVGYFIVNGSTKQYSFSVDRPVVISPQSSNQLYYCVNGLYYVD
ncbi:MAG: hypothetical protein EZS28_009335 [Streblomastix strix]|uniref:Uncharacterized protein n=1 Tax=Streblomastix strix TaxID=222440 RepID=A0A5J4WLD9_9EUKA|nr:MAG: hypothetical protein EZS28_009335 [Streblomastix strix]